VSVTGSTPVLALAGIASPDRFTRALETHGYRVTRAVGFRDHHPYDRRDLGRIADLFRASGAEAVLTTEKDAVRLLPLRPLPFPAAAVPLDVSVDPLVEFQAWLFARLAGVRA
jgi:tetraacyldisaccharide 4'-kinase